MVGRIYAITNLINGHKYVGQTTRDVNIRFHEHCYKGACKGIHRAIEKYGKENFSINILEDNIEAEKLNEREAYWIEKLDTYYNGYNQTLGGDQVGYNYKHIQIIENGYIVDSCQHLGRLFEQCGVLSDGFASEKFKKIVNTDKDIYGFHLVEVDDFFCELTDDEIIKKWIKSLPKQYQGNKIRCIELNHEENSIGEMAEYLYKNGYYSGKAANPKQAITSSISKECISPILSNLTFEKLGETTKTDRNLHDIFQKQKIYCPEIDKNFESQIDAARYFNENIWTDIKLKTAKLRISDVVNGHQQNYKGYTFVRI